MNKAKDIQELKVRDSVFGMTFKFWDRPMRRIVCFLSAFLLFLFDGILVAVLVIKKPEFAWVGWFYASATFLLIVGLFGLMQFLENLPNDMDEANHLLNKDQSVQASVATDDASSNQDDNIKKITHE